MRVNERQLRQIIREALLREATLADVEPEAAAAQRRYDNRLPGSVDPHTYTRKKDVVGNRRDTKRLWNKHADRSFFNDPKSLFIWHYLGHFSYNTSLYDYFPPNKIEIGAVPGINLPARDELSCFGKIVSEMTHPPDEGAYFTFKEYRVTFASKSDAETERLSMATPEDIERLRSSGLRKRPYPGMPFTAMPIDRAGAQEAKSRMLEEVVIDNWIIDTYYIRGGIWSENQEVKYAEKLGLKYEIIK